MRAWWLALLATAGCLRSVSYTCATSADCGAGRCEPDGLCSFTDASCASGYRYGDLAGASSNQCTGMSNPGGDGGASYTIGGMVSGLVGTVGLKNNGGDDKIITTNGAFMFSTALDSGAAYSVTVAVQPSMQTCSVANAMGTVGTAPVTDIAVTCASAGNGISCGGSTCTNGTMKCCHDDADANGLCKSPGAGCGPNKVNELCDDASDCGGGSNICCAPIASNGRLSGDVHCVSSPAACTGGTTQEYLCDPGATTPCPGTMTCVVDATFGWHRCQ